VGSWVNRQREASLERLELAAEAAGIGFWDWDLVADRLCPDAFLSARYGIGLRSVARPLKNSNSSCIPMTCLRFSRRSVAR
jgi:hypothetical protein